MTRDYTRDAILNNYHQKLPNIDAFVQTDSARVLYNALLDQRPGTPATINLQGNPFTKPACFQYKNGTWVVISTETARLKKIRKTGWYEDQTFIYDEALNANW